MSYWSGAKRDPFEERQETLSPIAPVSHCLDVTPQDSTDLPNRTRAIYATSPGNIAIVFADDDPGSGTHVIAFAAGEMKAIAARQIWNTLTTAGGIKAMW